MKSELYFVSDYCKKMMIINEIEYQINEIEKNINSIESNHSKINSKLFLSDEFLDYLEVCFHIDKQISSLFDLLSDKLRKQINLNKVVTLKRIAILIRKIFFQLLPTKTPFKIIKTMTIKLHLKIIKIIKIQINSFMDPFLMKKVFLKILI